MSATRCERRRRNRSCRRWLCCAVPAPLAPLLAADQHCSKPREQRLTRRRLCCVVARDNDVAAQQLQRHREQQDVCGTLQPRLSEYRSRRRAIDTRVTERATRTELDGRHRRRLAVGRAAEGARRGRGGGGRGRGGARERRRRARRARTHARALHSLCVCLSRSACGSLFRARQPPAFVSCPVSRSVERQKLRATTDARAKVQGAATGNERGGSELCLTRRLRRRPRVPARV